MITDLPVIAEATSSADDTHIVEKDSPGPSSAEYSADDDYSSNVETQEEAPTRWYHEHDYLKKVVEPESSGMENIDESFDNNMESEVDELSAENHEEDVETDGSPIASDNASSMTIKEEDEGGISNSAINTYDSELPQNIFQKHEDLEPAFQPSTVLSNNVAQRQEGAPVFVRQIIDPSCANRYKGAVIIQNGEDQNEHVHYNNEAFVVDESEIDADNCFKGESERVSSIERTANPSLVSDGLHMNLPKNVKLLTIPPTVKYNEKYIIEEVSSIRKITRKESLAAKTLLNYGLKILNIFSAWGQES